MRCPITYLSFATMLAVSGAASAEDGSGDQIGDVVVANRILADQGVVNGFGHISARKASDPHVMLIARSMAPALVTAADILEVNIESCEPKLFGRATYLERLFIAKSIRAERT